MRNFCACSPDTPTTPKIQLLYLFSRSHSVKRERSGWDRL